MPIVALRSDSTSRAMTPHGSRLLVAALGIVAVPAGLFLAACVLSELIRPFLTTIIFLVLCFVFYAYWRRTRYL